MWAKVLGLLLAVPLVGALTIVSPWHGTRSPFVKMAKDIRDRSLTAGGDLVTLSDPTTSGAAATVSWEARVAVGWKEYRRSLQAAMPDEYEVISSGENGVVFRKTIPQDVNVYLHAEPRSARPLVVSFDYRAVQW